jgi:hypothetical protein
VFPGVSKRHHPESDKAENHQHTSAGPSTILLDELDTQPSSSEAQPMGDDDHRLGLHGVPAERKASIGRPRVNDELAQRKTVRGCPW